MDGEVTAERLDGSLERLVAQLEEREHGLFGPGSASWRLGREAINFVGGGRAALLQLAHPAVAYAIEQHSKVGRDLRGRFQRTFQSVFSLTFGDWRAAEEAARRVHRIHDAVVGTIGEDAGRFREGQRYSATDPEALTWVWATLVDTVFVVGDRTGWGVSRDEKERYLREALRFAALFGLSAAELPATLLEFKYYFNKKLASGDLAVTSAARTIAGILLEDEHPGMGAMLAWYRAVTAELLPRRLAEDFGLAQAPWQRLVGRSSLRALGRVYPHLPQSVRLVPAYVDARRRLGQPAPALSRVSLWRLIEWASAR